jgi:hypothetical protein
MHLNHILEAADVDVTDLLAVAAREDCRGPLVVGGSLADGLGSELSDVDMTCFEPSSDGFDDRQIVSITSHRLGPLCVDLHRVSAPALTAICAPYREHCLSAPQRPLGRIPYDILVLLHALHSGIPVAEADQLNRLADAVGADLYPTILGLRALGEFLSRLKDGRQLATLQLTRPALAVARMAAEATADACLALSGRTNPNPKWRVLLLEHAARDPRQPAMPWPDLLNAFMGETSDGAAMLRTSVCAAKLVAEETTLAIYYEAAMVAGLAVGSGAPC